MDPRLSLICVLNFVRVRPLAASGSSLYCLLVVIKMIVGMKWFEVVRACVY